MKIYVGYDQREDIAFQVCEYSILKHNTHADVIPLKRDMLITNRHYNRPVDLLAATEFTLTRYLIPHLMNYKGWALYIDCDVLCLTNIQELFDQANANYALMCVQHAPYTPKTLYKMDGKIQTSYPRKNWSSVMLWNCAHPSNRLLTPNVVNKETPKYFHGIEWLKNELIGKLDVEWNWLVGYYNSSYGVPKILHYTDGGPWFKQYRHCEYSEVWKEYLMEMMLQ